MFPGKIPHLLEEQIGQSALYSGGNQKTLQLSSRIRLWGEGEQSVGALIAYLVCHLFQQTPSSATWGTPTTC
ncbi:hypothetical protein ACFXTN_036338 [Malus domestica]